ncbi:MAG: hypothetical protein WCD70_05750, partial [Alphaproteobacteria bacterium]
MTEQQSGETKIAPMQAANAVPPEKRNWLDRNVWVLVKPGSSTLTYDEMFGHAPLPKPLVFRIWLEEKGGSLYRKAGFAPRSNTPSAPPMFTLGDVFSRRPTVLG